MPWVWVSGKISCVNNIMVQTWFAKPLICRVTTFALLFKFPRKKDCDVPLFKVKDTIIYNIQFIMIIKIIIIKLKLLINNYNYYNKLSIIEITREI